MIDVVFYELTLWDDLDSVDSVVQLIGAVLSEVWGRIDARASVDIDVVTITLIMELPQGWG